MPAGLLLCEAASPAVGRSDPGVPKAGTASGNRTSPTGRCGWPAKASGGSRPTDHDRMDLLPERKRYEPGESRCFQVRMPFREATALVSVEREGVMETWVRKISGREPVVHIPVKGNYAPNVFVSVLAVRGRIGAVQPTAMADLGKPAFKLGMAEIDVGWRAHELKVSVDHGPAASTTSRDTARRSRVRAVDGRRPAAAGRKRGGARRRGRGPAGTHGQHELGPAARHDGTARLRGADGYGPDAGGRQAPLTGSRRCRQGGGGGRQATRELFDTLLLWKARLPLDARRRGDGRGAAQRRHHLLPHRRRRQPAGRASSGRARPRSDRPRI